LNYAIKVNFCKKSYNSDFCRNDVIIAKKNANFAELLLFLFFNLKKLKKMNNNLQTQVVAKIKRLRRDKGISQVQMADLLSVDKSVYARLELGQIDNWAKYLGQLLEIFNLTPNKFFEDICNNVTINNNNCPYSGNNGNVQNFYAENREIYEKLLATKEEQIALLKEMLDKKL
jgi:transcriptional regulator with XRE-family HTH domain